MATSWGQRKILGKRYSYDPALAYELERLQNEYNLAPGREARGMQAKQFEQSQGQQAGQYQQSMTQQGEQFTQTKEQQARQYEQTMAQNQLQANRSYELEIANQQIRQEEFDSQMKLAKDNYDLAVKNAKSADEKWAAELEYKKKIDQLNLQKQQEDRDAQAKAAQTGAITQLGGTAALVYGMSDSHVLGTAAEKALSGLTGAGTGAGYTAPSTLPALTAEEMGTAGMGAGTGTGTGSSTAAIGGQALAYIAAAELARGQWGGQGIPWEEKTTLQRVVDNPVAAGVMLSLAPWTVFGGEGDEGPFKEMSRIERQVMAPIDWLFGSGNWK